MTNHENTNNEAKDSSQIILFHSASYKVKKNKLIIKNRDWCKKKRNWPKNFLLIKNPYIHSDQADILVVLPTHEITNLTKFYCNKANIVDFLVMGKLGARSFF